MSHIVQMPNEILLKIFEFCDTSTHFCRRDLPLVCKRWRTVIFESRGVLFHEIYLLITSEAPALNVGACGAWLQRHMATGCISRPLHLSVYDQRGAGRSNPSSPNAEEFCGLLGCLGQELVSLSICRCTHLFNSRSFGVLWALTNITDLKLTFWGSLIEPEDFERGMQHLRLFFNTHKETCSQSQISAHETCMLMAFFFLCCRKLQRFEISSKTDEDGIYMGQGGLAEFPQVLCSLTTLERLHFTGQYLRHIPQDISQLRRLSCLSMVGGCVLKCPVGHLPSVLARLPSLNHLAIEGRLTTIAAASDAARAPVEDPDLWRHVSSLQSLYLYPGTFSLGPGEDLPGYCLPSEVAFMTSLQEITLLAFASSPEEPDLSALKKLTSLEFHGSTFSAFPAWPAKIPSLQSLSMHGCCQEWHIPGSYTALQELTINSRDLREVPESIGALTALTRLDLEHCGVAKISPSMSKLVLLRGLNFKNNYIYPEVPAELSGLTSLRVLYLRNNTARKIMNVKFRRDGGRVLLRPEEVTDGGRRPLRPKMAVTEKRLRWLLQCPHLQQVYLDVTREERDKLRKLRQELRSAHGGRSVLCMKIMGQYM